MTFDGIHCEASILDFMEFWNMKKHITPQRLQVGTYKISNIYYLNGDNRMPIAIATYKGPNWYKSDLKPRHIKLQSLYNTSSIGPKLEFPAEDLPNCCLYINELNIISEPNAKTKFSVEWNVNLEDEDEAFIKSCMEYGNEIEIESGDIIDPEFAAIEFDCMSEDGAIVIKGEYSELLNIHYDLEIHMGTIIVDDAPDFNEDEQYHLDEDGADLSSSTNK